MNFENTGAKNLGVSQKESFEEKKDNLKLVKDILEARFGLNKLPDDFVLEMVDIRKRIKDDIDKIDFVDELDENIEHRISLLVEGIADLNEADQESKEILFDSLKWYFDSYRLAHNAGQFRKNVGEIEDFLVKGNLERKVNFYSDKEKQEEVVVLLFEKYEKAGFSEQEIQELLEFCKLDDLASLPIYKIKVMSQIQDIFVRFMGGDKAKYVGLSAALMVPAFIQGYAPMLFADAFKDNTTDVNQIILYSLASIGGAGLSVLIQKHYKDFINQNYQKEGGISELAAKNLTEMPPDETKKFGLDTVKRRTSSGIHSYESILNTFSFNILPTITTLVTSAVMLYEKSPILAGGTVVASGLTIALDKYFQKVGKFWERERGAERTSEQMAKKLNEQLSSHMEVILAGEKEKFFNEIKDFVEKEKMAQTSKNFFQVMEDGYFRFSNAINLTLLGGASLLAGGSADKMIAAILYSGNFNQGIQKLLSANRKLLTSLRNVMQMELMFNGYAQEEDEKEKSRLDISEIKNSDLELKNVNVEVDGKKILNNINLEIPTGAMAYLEGASGAGKTTLMKVISGYYRPTSGEIKFGEEEMENIKKSGTGSIYNRIAYLSQFPYLFDDSVRNNLKFGLKGEVSEVQILEVLSEVGLSNRFAKNLDEKLYGGLGDSGKTSGGETSRIGLARVLLKIRNSDSKLVFLDEPTASVDAATKKDIADIINKEKIKKPNTTFIVISHDEKFIEMLNCTIKIKMDKGKILEE